MCMKNLKKNKNKIHLFNYEKVNSNSYRGRLSSMLFCY